MKDKFDRDEMFYRIAHINNAILENKEDVLRDMSRIENPNFQDAQGTSYLHMACQAHSIEAVQLLLELGANPNINDKRGFSPIMSALGTKNVNNGNILKMMLRNGLDIEKKEGDMELIKMIEMFNNSELNDIIKDFEP